MERLVLQQVQKRFGPRVEILQGVSYTFEAGRFYGIIGASGAGKTTLLQIMGTLEEPTGGRVVINGRDSGEMSVQERAKLRNEQIGFVFQSFYLNAYLTAVENVMMPMLITKVDFDECRKRAEKLLEQMGLRERLEHYPAQLSGGEQQRVALARALANRPNIILADEPTGNLDEANEDNVMGILRKLADEGMTVIMVTHNQRLLQQVDRILRLADGQLKSIGGDGYV